MIQVTASVDGQSFLVDSAHVTSGSYGSIGHAVLCTNQGLLTSSGISLFDIASSASGSVEIDLDVTLEGDDQSPQRIFSGELVDTHWRYDLDEVEIHARDWAGLLVDQKRILAKLANQIVKALAPLRPGQTLTSSGVATQNQTVGNIVTAIANEFGLTPVLNLSNGNPTYGSIYGSSDTVFTSMPQSLWSVLCQLARDTGYDVYVTPKKELVFGEPGAGLSTLKLSYNTNPVPDGAVPCRKLEVEHHPRRNATFRVIVLGYDPARAQTVIGRANVVGSGLAGQAGLRPGVTSGSSAAVTDKALAALGKHANVSEVPLYTFHIDGITAAQAQQKAEAIATDISKRELIMNAEFDIYPGITPTQPVSVSGSVDDFVSGNQFYVNSYTHTFRMPRGGGRDTNSGLMTHIRALDIPTLGKGTDSSAL